MDVFAYLVGAFGIIAGSISAYAGLMNARTSQKSTLVQASTFLQAEVTRLNEENDKLIQDKHDLQIENDRMSRLLRQSRTRRLTHGEETEKP